MNRLLPVLLLAGMTFASYACATSPLSSLQALAAHGARVSALVVRLSDRKTLAELKPDLALTPASTSKLYVAASALRQWGADYRFTTRLLGNRPGTERHSQGQSDLRRCRRPGADHTATICTDPALGRAGNSSRYGTTDYRCRLFRSHRLRGARPVSRARCQPQRL